MAFGIDGDRINPAGLMAIGTRLENAIAAAAYVAETGRGWVESLQIVDSAFEEADRYMPQKAEHTPLTDGALMLIQQLHKAGVKLAILSSDGEANVIEFMEKFELKPYFQGFYGVKQQYPTKSDPALLKQLFLSLQLQPEQALMIGDSQVDVQIARDTGMAGCVGFAGGWTSALLIQGVDITVNQLEQIEIQ
jgi:phosphoglycolate phosphatase